MVAGEGLEPSLDEVHCLPQMSFCLLCSRGLLGFLIPFFLTLVRNFCPCPILHKLSFLEDEGLFAFQILRLWINPFSRWFPLPAWWQSCLKAQWGLRSSSGKCVGWSFELHSPVSKSTSKWLFYTSVPQ